MKIYDNACKRYVNLDEYDIQAENECRALLRGFKSLRPKSYSTQCLNRSDRRRNVTKAKRQGKNGRQVCLKNAQVTVRIGDVKFILPV